MLKELALQIAIGELGNGEEGKNNAGPHIEKYLNGLAEPPANWCAAFVSWCYTQAAEINHYIVPFQYSLSARAIMTEIKTTGKKMQDLVSFSKTNPKAGDLVFFWRDNPNSWMGHVGIIAFAGLNSINVIEGNVGKFPSKVKFTLYKRDHERLLGYGHIKY
jgi:hypothetical protein